MKKHYYIILRGRGLLDERVYFTKKAATEMNTFYKRWFNDGGKVIKVEILPVEKSKPKRK